MLKILNVDEKFWYLFKNQTHEFLFSNTTDDQEVKMNISAKKHFKRDLLDATIQKQKTLLNLKFRLDIEKQNILENLVRIDRELSKAASLKEILKHRRHVEREEQIAGLVEGLNILMDVKKERKEDGREIRRRIEEAEEIKRRHEETTEKVESIVGEYLGENLLLEFKEAKRLLVQNIKNRKGVDKELHLCDIQTKLINSFS